MANTLARLWRRLTAAETDPDRPAPDQPDPHDQPIRSCRERERAAVSGRITSVTPAARTADPSLTIEVADPSGTVAAVWLGRREIPGIELGRTVRLEGRVSRRGDRLTLYNPRYELHHRAP